MLRKINKTNILQTSALYVVNVCEKKGMSRKEEMEFDVSWHLNH